MEKPARTGLVITVLGRDKVGIVAAVSAVLASHYANIEDISQTILQEVFSMVMLVGLDESKTGIPELQAALDKVGERMGLEIKIRQEDLFKYMHRI